MSHLTNFVFLPNGRILAIGKEGDVRQGTFGGSVGDGQLDAR